MYHTTRILTGTATARAFIESEVGWFNLPGFNDGITTPDAPGDTAGVPTVPFDPATVPERI